MVQYGHSVKELCLKTSHLPMRGRNLEEKNPYFQKYLSWNVIHNFPTPEASSFLLYFSLEKYMESQEP